MAFPFYYHRVNDKDSEPHYPPPGHRPPDSDPPPQLVLHIHHHIHYGEAPPPSCISYQSNDYGNSSRPSPPVLHHHSHNPHSSTVIHQHYHQSDSPFSNRPTVKVYTKANPNFSLAIRDDTVVLVPFDPDDPTQHWFKDEKYSTRIKDEEGCPCFSLVNKATGQAMKHSIGDSHPVQLTCYDPNVVNGSILWTQGRELGDGYRAMRMLNNIHLNVDAFRGNKDSDGVHDGTPIVLWKWNEGENQLWKIVPYCKFFLFNTMEDVVK